VKGAQGGGIITVKDRVEGRVTYSWWRNKRAKSGSKKKLKERRTLNMETIVK